jgi:ferredoxin
MRVEVDLDRCVGHGICESIAQDVFEMQDYGTVRIEGDEQPESDRDRMQQAVTQCPAAALRLMDWSRKSICGCGIREITTRNAISRAWDAGVALRQGSPSALITCSELDPLRDEAVDYAVRLMRSGVAVELHVFPGTCHGFDAFVPNWPVTRQLYEIQGAALLRAFMNDHSWSIRCAIHDQFWRTHDQLPVSLHAREKRSFTWASQLNLTKKRCAVQIRFHVRGFAQPGGWFHHCT